MDTLKQRAVIIGLLPPSIKADILALAASHAWSVVGRMTDTLEVYASTETWVRVIENIDPSLVVARPRVRRLRLRHDFGG
jgi:hypothetical protein